MRLMRERDVRDAHWRTWLLKRSRLIAFAFAMVVFLILALLFHEEAPEKYEVSAVDCPLVFNVA